jgi:predicted nuclease of predicted toxin-antitoxin system
VKFFVDEQLPIGLARWLRWKGHEAEHIDELGLRASPDMTISQLVAEAGGIVVTKDSDFIELRRRRPDFQIVWLRTGNIGTSQLLGRLDEVWPEVVSDLSAGAPVVEVR